MVRCSFKNNIEHTPWCLDALAAPNLLTLCGKIELCTWERRKVSKGQKWMGEIIESGANCRTCRPPACWQLSAPFSTSRLLLLLLPFSRTLSKLLDTFNYGNRLTLWWFARIWGFLYELRQSAFVTSLFLVNVYLNVRTSTIQPEAMKRLNRPIN